MYKLLDSLLFQYVSFIYLGWFEIFLALTVILSALISHPCSPGALAVWPLTGFLVWMGQIEKTWSSSSPQLQNLYARHVQHQTGVVQPRQNSTDSLFHHFPEHHRRTALPSHQPSQPEPLLHQTKHVSYYCTSLTGRPELGQVFVMTDFLRLVSEFVVLPTAD